MAEKIVEDTLENWSIGEHPSDAQHNKYLPPEFHRRSLSGFSQERDGKHIWTSPIEKMLPLEKAIITRKGTKYHLGKPDPEYVEWCRTNGHHIPTVEQPLPNAKT